MGIGIVILALAGMGILFAAGESQSLESPDWICGLVGRSWALRLFVSFFCICHTDSILDRDSHGGILPLVSIRSKKEVRQNCHVR